MDFFCAGRAGAESRVLVRQFLVEVIIGDPFACVFFFFLFEILRATFPGDSIVMGMIIIGVRSYMIMWDFHNESRL